jgi:hypothetical protein
MGAAGLATGALGLAPDPMQGWREQTAANRPNQYNPYGSSEWTQGPNGQWTQNLGFNDALQGANESLQNQWAKNAATGYGNGWDAFGMGRDAAMGSYQSMLDPMWSQRENAQRSQLINSGGDASADINKDTWGNFNDSRTKAYSDAMRNSISAGFGAQGQMFQQNRQAWLDPLQAMSGMKSLLEMPNFTPAGSPPSGAALGTAQHNAGQWADMFSGAGDMITGFMGGGASGAAPGGGGAPFSFGGGTGFNPNGGSVLDPGSIFSFGPYRRP